MTTAKRALLSVSDKTGVIDFAKQLASIGFELLSTGGTARTLREAGLSVTDVAQVTGFPEIMDGRVKTLHPKIHGGLLGRLPLDSEVMAQHAIQAIDVVVVNLYPFAETIAKTDVSLEDAIENIDIGGPAMLRAAAKNHERVWVLVDPADYASAAAALAAHDSREKTLTRRQLAAKVYAHTARYDGQIAAYLRLHSEAVHSEAVHSEAVHSEAVSSSSSAEQERQQFPPVLTLQVNKSETLRYGENPHQSAALYLEADARLDCVAKARFVQGKALSYNNLADADAAVECVRLFVEPTCVIVKHANPCGVSSASTLLAAYQNALACDPVSAFGGILAFNRELDGETAKALIKVFSEVVIAPSFSTEALAHLASKANVRVLATGELNPASAWSDYKRIQGGLLVQSGDWDVQSEAGLKVVSQRMPSEQELRDLHFAWRVAMQVKSNAIVYAREQRTIGVGAGQMSRVISAKIAAWKAQEAGLQVQGAVMASDAFFPFRDGIDAAAAAGIRAVIQPGGSKRDAEVIAAANEHDIAMVFTGIRHFRH